MHYENYVRTLMITNPQPCAFGLQIRKSGERCGFVYWVAIIMASLRDYFLKESVLCWEPFSLRYAIPGQAQ